MSPTFERAALIADPALGGRAFVDAYTAAVDGWLAELFAVSFPDRGRVALVATGGQGRGELTPGSDLDLLLLHDGGIDPGAAERLWYPIWDAGLKLGHAVRTPGETLALARSDLATATSLLSVRCLAGDEQLAAELAAAASAQWAKGAKRSLSELADAVDARQLAAGDVAFALEPDLKDGRGGLRGVHAIEWAASALDGIEPGIAARLGPHYDVLLDARVELHRATGRNSNVLTLQDQDDVARRLGDADADVLMARVAAAARVIGWESDEVFFDVRRLLGRGRSRRDRSQFELGHGVRLLEGRVRLTGDVQADELSVLRVAAAAAARGTRIHRGTLELLRSAPELPDPWPVEARRLFVDLLASGHQAVPVVESLDHAGLWTRILPEWEPNRSRPQRNAYHRFTVDRHLLEATANAAALTGRVTRPDLLLLGTLLHDIGKGYSGDHAVVGRDLARTICTRMGYPLGDVELVERLVALHLLLPDAATRRDLDDPVTIHTVTAQVLDLTTLEVLHALTEADSLATGPAAWGSWKAELVADLVERATHVLGGGDVGTVTTAPLVTEAQHELLARCEREGRPVLSVLHDRLTVVAVDRHGLFSRVAGVLALHGLDVVEASARNEGGFVLDEFRVVPTHGTAPRWDDVGSDIDRALRGRLAIETRLADRERSYRRRQVSARGLEPYVRILADASEDSTVVEVVGPDSVGLLYRLTRALADLDLDIVSAKAVTMATDVVDAFYVRTSEGGKLADPADVAEVRAALLHAMRVVRD